MELDIEQIKKNFLAMSDDEKKVATKKFCEAINEAAKDIVNNADEIWNNRNKL